MRHRITTQPASEPISLEEAKAHLRVDVSDDDAYITGLIAAARQYCEGATSRAFIEQTITLELEAFPCRAIELPRPPLISVTSVKYLNADGDLVTLVANTDYKVIASSDTEPGRIIPAYGTSWPTPGRCEEDAVQIVYKAGWADATDVPLTIRQAILLAVGHWYETREAVSEGPMAEVPLAVDSLLGMVKVHTAV